MKIAILSDIHGNAYALQAVLKQCIQQEIDYYFVLGDCIGYYHQPKKVMDLLQTLDFSIVKGNHEEFLERVLKNELSLTFVNEKYGTGIERAIQQLCDDQIQLLVSCPYEIIKVIDNITIKFVHADYTNWGNYLYPDSRLEQLQRFCEGDFDFIFFGHSHYPFSFTTNNTHLVNVGSVGQNKGYGGTASWAVLHTASKTVVMHNTPYDIQPLLQDIEVEQTSNKAYLSAVLKRNN